jgi:20S proteasome subunit beta 1
MSPTLVKDDPLSPPARCACAERINSMAINFKDGVILGADSRTTTGAYIANRVTDKLTQVHDTIWCCRSGSAADTQAVADIVHYHLGMYGMQNDEPPTTQIAAAIFQELCYDNKDQLRLAAYRNLV